MSTENQSNLLYSLGGLTKSQFSEITSTPKSTIDTWFATSKFPGWVESWLRLYTSNKDLEATIRVLTGKTIETQLTPIYTKATIEKKRQNIFPLLIEKGILRDGDKLSFVGTEDEATVVASKNKVRWTKDGELYSLSHLAQIILNTTGAIRGTDYWIHENTGESIVSLAESLK